MPKAPRESPCYVYEFTLGASDPDITVDDVRNSLTGYCKDFVFQLERGTLSTEKNNDGYLHYQGRLTLIKKRRTKELAQLLREVVGWSKIDVRPTVEANTTKTAFYCLKNDTRVDGPWKMHDIPSTYKRYKVLTRDQLYPWQAEFEDRLAVFDERTVNMIIDTQGCQGKTAMCRYLNEQKKVKVFKAMDSIKDIMQAVMSIGTPYDGYVFDIPRGLSKKRMGSFFAGVEALKDGFAMDHRYKYRDMWFDPPQIWIFSNKEPNRKYLSMDRWRLWTIKDKRLVDFCFRDGQQEEEEQQRVLEQEVQGTDGGEEEELPMEEEVHSGQDRIRSTSEESDHADGGEEVQGDVA